MLTTLMSCLICVCLCLLSEQRSKVDTYESMLKAHTVLGIPAPVIKWSKDGGATFPAAVQHRLFVRPNDDHLYVVNVTVEDQVRKIRKF